MRQHWRLALLALFLFAGSFLLDTLGNQFPYYYHPDEARKVRQILSGERNFNHPLLLLSAVESLWKLSGSPRDFQRVVEIGRDVSALFAAGGTVLFFLAAWFLAGRIAALTTGLLLMCHQQVFELSHYLKEDPALYFGTGLSVLALVWHAKRPGRFSIVALGTAVGVAASAKYLGAILIVPALVTVWLVSQRKWRDALTVIAVSVFVFVLINHRLFLEWPRFQQSFTKEIDQVATGQDEVTRRVPHAIYLNIFASNTTPVVWVLLAASLVALWKRAFSSPIPAVITATAAGWLVLMSFSPKINDRYFLPLTGLFYLMAGFGAAFLWQYSNGWKRLALSGLLAASLIWEGAQTWQYAAAFQVDDRRDLMAWMRSNIPENAGVAYDSRTNLFSKENPTEEASLLPRTFTRETYVADLAAKPGGFEAENIQYVIISESIYGRFFLASLRPKAGQMAEFERRRDFYQKLRNKKPLWARPRGKVIYLHPGMEVYAVGSE